MNDQPAAPLEQHGYVALWTMIWVAFSAGILFGVLLTDIKIDISKRLSGEVHDLVGCQTIPGDVCR